MMQHLGQRQRRRQPVLQRRHPLGTTRPQQQRQLERQPARPRRVQHAGAAERPPRRHPRRQGQRGRPELDSARRDRARRGAEGRRLRDLRHRRDRRRDQLHPAQGLQGVEVERLRRHHRGRRRQHLPRLDARGLGRPLEGPLQRDGHARRSTSRSSCSAASASSPTASSPSAASRRTRRARPTPRTPASPAPPSAPPSSRPRHRHADLQPREPADASRAAATSMPEHVAVPVRAVGRTRLRAMPAPTTTAEPTC